MTTKTTPVTFSALFLVLWGCQPSQALVAYSYGDYDPNNPPTIRPIDGGLSITDPSLFFWRGTYYVFSSGSSGSGLDLHTSKDLRTFKLEKPILSPNPLWVAPTLKKVTDLWSPCVLAWGGTIHIYFAASWFGAARACIGHATTPSMDQPFVDDPEPLICSSLSDTLEPYVAIDPAVILDDAGDPWMVFGSWAEGIHVIALDHQGRRRDSKAPQMVAARAPGDPVAIQAASLYHWRDYFYLFVSHESSPHHILRVGRSKKVAGPYYDRDGKSMTTGGGTLVLQGDEFFKGPGSNMVYDDGEQRLNVYHAYNATDDVVLRIAELAFDQDGWPVAAGP
jgi:arabinan endo-1,5-alpha-L-arabinosidase